MIARGDLVTSNGCDNSGATAQIGTSVFNSNDNSPAYVGYMYGETYPYSSSNWTSNARFGSSFTWNGTNYTLVDDTVTTPNATHHYSCNVTTENGTCTEIRYVYYYYAKGSAKYYITLTGGDGIEQAMEKMQTNTNSSTTKIKIDTWYASNMNSVTNKLEDTIWCSDRSIGKYNGWTPTGAWGESSYKDYSLLFGAYERSNIASTSSTVKNQPSLVCTNVNDAFAVNKGNKKLQYPVALLSKDEIELAGGLADGLSTFYLNNGSSYWSLSPSFFSNVDARVFIVSNGNVGTPYVTIAEGLRPSIALKIGAEITSGDGTVTSPYVIKN
jgi:hypothetical protein